jgi:hypothetical protein
MIYVLFVAIPICSIGITIQSAMIKYRSPVRRLALAIQL